MSDAIGFLEKMGQDATLRYARPDELEQALHRARIDRAVGAAIVSGDEEQIESLLGVEVNVCCFVHAPDGDDEEPNYLVGVA